MSFTQEQLWYLYIFNVLSNLTTWVLLTWTWVNILRTRKIQKSIEALGRGVSECSYGPAKQDDQFFRQEYKRRSMWE